MEAFDDIAPLAVETVHYKLKNIYYVRILTRNKTVLMLIFGEPNMYTCGR